MNDKQLERIIEIKETILKMEGIKKQLDEKIFVLQEERQAIELSDIIDEVPPLEPEESVEG